MKSPHPQFISDFEELMKSWHPSKNSNINPANITIGSGKKIWWLCPNKNCSEGCLHEYQQTVVDKVRGKECPYCCRHPKKVCYHNSIAYTHQKEVKYWHPTKNGNLNPSFISAKSGIKVWWLCPKRCSYGCMHEYQQVICIRLSLKNIDYCPYCANLQCCQHTSFASLHPNLLKEWDYQKNDIDPTKVSPSYSDFVWWICKKGHSYKSRITNRCHAGYGCTSCVRKTETRVYEFLLNYYPDSIRELKLENCKDKSHLPFDICIPSLKTIVEVDGEQHFKRISNWQSPEITLQKDIYKMKKAEESGYRVLRLPQRDISENFLTDELLKEIQSGSSDHCFLSEQNHTYDKYIQLLTDT